MKYYYSKGGQPVGPMTRSELDALVANGTITAQAHVYKKGNAAWMRYHELAAAEPVAAPEPVSAKSISVAIEPIENEVKVEPVVEPVAVEPVVEPVAVEPVVKPVAPQPAPQPAAQNGAPAVGTVLSMCSVMKFLSYNQWVDDRLARIFKLPRWFGDTEEALHEKITFVSSVTAFISWAVLVLCAIGMMDIMAILIALVGGALAQYVVYLVCSMLAALLKGPRVVLSSMAAPRLVGYLALLTGIAYLITAGYMAYEMLFGAVIAALGLMGISVVTTYACFNADKLIVDVKPQESNPGRDFNNLLKFILRCWATVQFLLAPVIMVIAAISNIIFQIQIAVKESELEELGYGGWMMRREIDILKEMSDTTLAVAVLTPIAIWLIYSLISWLLDLLDGLFSLGGSSRKEKEQG